MTLMTIAGMTVLVLVTGGCMRTDIMPDQFEGKIDRNLRYADLELSPETYKGKLMLLGGRVLSGERLPEGTKLEVLQTSLSRMIPDGPESDSKGRFVVIDRSEQITNPEIFTSEKRITLVAEVLGTTTVRIDAAQQPVPLLALKHVTVWDWDRPKAGDAQYYGHGYPIWGYRGYGSYAYPWW